ncbi:MAG TPA: glycosyltransferase family 2 protein [Myxococcota bacterium]|nr:glycosyltransferase family 2 protein [Myxococcota bacterium]
MSADRPKAPPISGVVICLNEADRIGRCLESLAFCDELVVVDSGSTDGTRDVARRYTEHTIEQPFLGYVKQKNFALERAKHDWVICLDADEALSPELRESLQAALARVDDRVSGYELDRVTHYLGVWHDHGEWYPDWQLRVFRRSRGRWAGMDPHDRVELDGRVERLSGRLLHWNYRSLSEHIQTTDRFSARMAGSMQEAGVRFRLADLLLRPIARFFKGYVLRQGFRDGMAGFVVSAATAYYVFMKYAKLWELERGSDDRVGTLPTLRK